MRLGWLTALAVVWALAGCAYIDAILAPEAMPDKAAEKTAETAARPTAPPAKRPPSPPAPSLFDPKQLIGLDPAETEGLLGKPDEIREGSPATVWRYRTASCTLDLFFYFDLGSSALRALAYDVRAANRVSDTRAIKVCAGRIHSEYRDGKR